MHGGMTAKMFEPLLMKECRMASVDDNHPLWPEEAGEPGQGAGAEVPLTSEDPLWITHWSPFFLQIYLAIKKKCQRVPLKISAWK